MKRKTEKFIFILMGLLIGFALGISIIFWKQSIKMTREVFHETKEYITGFFKSETYKAPVTEIKVIKKKPIKKKKIQAVEQDTSLISFESDSTMDIYADMTDTFPEEIWNEDYSDIYDELNGTSTSESIAKDRLISQKQIQAININPVPASGKNLDSLLIGGKGPKKTGNTFNVEFWESPLNYKGYKKNNNLLLIYGVKHFEDACLKLLNNDLYLCCETKVYKLDNSPDFKNLIPVTNTEIINQLKEK